MKNSQSNPIDVNAVYTQASLADALEVSERWILDNLITPRRIRFKKQGRIYLFLGKWVAEWARKDHELPDDLEPSLDKLAP